MGKFETLLSWNTYAASHLPEHEFKLFRKRRQTNQVTQKTMRFLTFRVAVTKLGSRSFFVILRSVLFDETPQLKPRYEMKRETASCGYGGPRFVF
jgi:hypothetical protein